jgi:hypothetical protein
MQKSAYQEAQVSFNEGNIWEITSLGSLRVPCTHGLIKGNPTRINDVVTSKLIELINGPLKLPPRITFLLAGQTLVQNH